MSTALDGFAGYSAFVYALGERHPFVTGATLTLVPIGATLAKLEGEIECQGRHSPGSVGTDRLRREADSDV